MNQLVVPSLQSDMSIRPSSFELPDDRSGTPESPVTRRPSQIFFVPTLQGVTSEGSRSLQLDSKKSWQQQSPRLSWNSPLSPVSLEIQRAELLRAQLLSRGGSELTPLASPLGPNRTPPRSPVPSRGFPRSPARVSTETYGSACSTPVKSDEIGDGGAAAAVGGPAIEERSQREEGTQPTSTIKNPLFKWDPHQSSSMASSHDPDHQDSEVREGGSLCLQMQCSSTCLTSCIPGGGGARRTKERMVKVVSSAFSQDFHAYVLRTPRRISSAPGCASFVVNDAFWQSPRTFGFKSDLTY